MAQLFRFLYTDDRYKSEIFTFMLPSNFILDTNDCELKSRDFTSSNQKWSLSFSKINNQLNVFLTLKSACEHMIVTADFGVTLVNREHFTRNEAFFEKNFNFTHEHSTHGRKSFVNADALCTLDFMDERGNIQCELEIRNVNTAYSYQTHVPVTPSYNRSPAELKFVSSIFMFGNYQWNVCIQPKLDSVGGIACLKFYLCRTSSLDHLCRITYRFKFINGAFVHDSGVLEQYSDLNGASSSYRMDKVKELLQLTGKFVVRLELIKINSIFSVILYPFSTPPPHHHKRAQAASSQQIANTDTAAPVTIFLDRDGQKWSLESHIEDNCFILRLFYIDINNIPIGYVRLMSFNIAVRHQQQGSVYVFKKPVIKYYYKQEVDDGLEITTTIDVNDIISPNGGYLDKNGGITIEIETHYSHLLHQPEYSHLDDIIRKHKLQMLREIQTLQMENYNLEKQLHNANNNPQSGGGPMNNNNNNVRTKSFDNPSCSSTASSMSGVTAAVAAAAAATNISSNNTAAAAAAANQNNLQYNSAPTTPHVVRKYYEQKYGSNTSVANSAATMMPNVLNNYPNNASNSSMMTIMNQQQHQLQQNGSPKTGIGSQQQQQLPHQMQQQQPQPSSNQFQPFQNFMNNPANNGISNLTSQLTSGFANLKLTATSKLNENKLTSKFMSPFS